MGVNREALGFITPSDSYVYGDIDFGYDVAELSRVNGQTVVTLDHHQFNFKTTPCTDNRGHPIPDCCKRDTFNMIPAVTINRNNVRYCVVIEDEGEFVLLLSFVLSPTPTHTHTHII